MRRVRAEVACRAREGPGRGLAKLEVELEGGVLTCAGRFGVVTGSSFSGSTAGHENMEGTAVDLSTHLLFLAGSVASALMLSLKSSGIK